MSYGTANNTPVYGYRTARQTTSLPAYYGAASAKPKGLLGGSFASSFLQSPLVAGATAGSVVQPHGPTGISQAGVAKQTTGFNEGQVSAGAAGAKPGDVVQPTQPGLVYDFTTDPILQSIQALSTSQRENADSDALGLKKQIAVKYGDSKLAGTFGDDATAKAAADNPYGVFQQLQKQQGDAATNLDEQFNQNNLFYGGARVKGQHDLADMYGKAGYDETGNEQSALDMVEHNRLAAILAADERDRQAAQNAQALALQAALANAGPGSPAGAGGASAGTPAQPLLGGSFNTSFLQPSGSGGAPQSILAELAAAANSPEAPGTAPASAFAGIGGQAPGNGFVPPSILDGIASAAKAKPKEPQFGSNALFDALADMANKPPKKPKPAPAQGKKPLL